MAGGSSHHPRYIQCRYFIRRKNRYCSHMVGSAEDKYCSLHHRDALEESRQADFLARCASESRAVLQSIIEAVERRFGVDTLSDSSHTTKKRRIRNKRISAPGRMANPFSLKLSPALQPVDWAAVFEDIHRPLHLDIGCARGRFLHNLSNKPHRSSWNHLGIEIRPDLIAEALQQIQKERYEQIHSLRNIHFLALNFSVSAAALFDSLPFSAFRLISFQFPDPWTTKKYIRRRIIQPELVNIIVRSLVDRGFIFVSSDCHHLAMHMKSVLTAHPLLLLIQEDDIPSLSSEWVWGGMLPKSSCSRPQNVEPSVAASKDDMEDDGRGWLSFNPLGAPSERELVCEKAWKPVWRCVAQKRCIHGA